MSYPKDLDEYNAAELEQELRQRAQKRSQGKCDYCNRPRDTPPCKFPHRHEAIPGNSASFKIVESDNFGGDYPDESVLPLPFMTREHATSVAEAINGGFPNNMPRFWRVVTGDYALKPGFEP